MAAGAVTPLEVVAEGHAEVAVVVVENPEGREALALHFSVSPRPSRLTGDQ